MFHNIDHSNYNPMQRDNLDMLILPLNLWQHPVFIPLMIMNYDKKCKSELANPTTDVFLLCAKFTIPKIWSHGAK